MDLRPVTVVETASFLRLAADIWAEDERRELVDYMARNPESGVVIPGTGGVRKLRWARQGSGKRGGARVIYFYHHMNAPIFLLLAYAKSRSEDMTADQKRAVAQVAAELKTIYPTTGGRQ